MNGYQKSLIASLLTVLVLTASPLRADQKDVRLDNLFAELVELADTSSAGQIIGDIWTIWIEAPDKPSQELMDQGIRAMNEQSLQDALQIFSDLISLDPEFAEAWNKRATVHYMLGNIDKSAADVKKTLELEPRHFGALSGLGLLYSVTGRENAAIAAFEEALKVNPHLTGPKKNIESLRQKLRDEKGDLL